MIAHDLYAETNPAFGAYVLVSIVRGFSEFTPDGPDLPLAYIALPLALSGDLAESFNGTNRKTGLHEWFERTPKIQIDLADRLNSSMPLVTDAVRLGCFSKILSMDDTSRLTLGPRGLKKDMTAGLSEDLTRLLGHATRLGYWCGAAGSTKTIYDMMGITP